MNRIELSDKEWVRILAHLKKLQSIHIGLMPARLGWQTVQAIMKRWSLLKVGSAVRST